MLPGVAVSVGVALLASALALVLPVVPMLTIAVALGIVVGQVPAARGVLDGPLAPGLKFASKTLMRFGIVLLGLKLSLIDIADLGIVAVVAVIALVVVTFFATWWFGRLMRLPGNEPLLVAAGFSICGASAIGAMGSATRSDAKEQATPVALVTLCGTLAIVVLPAAGAALGLDAEQFGHWVGASVHDVGQVVATAQTAGTAALAIAVVVKLTRVLMLAPMVAIATGVSRRMDAAAARTAQAPGSPTTAAQTTTPGAPAAPATPAAAPAAPRAPLVPLFIVGFLLAVLANTFLPIPEPVLSALDTLQVLVLGAALFALGTAVRLARLVTTGWRALVVGLASWAFIAVLALGVIQL
nr:putative sulfate exporter family transporter [Marisediminicola senii]